MQTIATTYRRNADGELTAVTTSTNSGDTNIIATPAALLNLDFGEDPGFEFIGYTYEGSLARGKLMRASDRGVSQSRYIKANVAAEQPEKLPQATERTHSARDAARILQKLGR